LDEQIKEHKASAKVSLALHFDRELAAAEECAKTEIFRKHLSTASGQRC
jgi:hypothetical protein